MWSVHIQYVLWARVPDIHSTKGLLSYRLVVLNLIFIRVSQAAATENTRSSYKTTRQPKEKHECIYDPPLAGLHRLSQIEMNRKIKQEYNFELTMPSLRLLVVFLMGLSTTSAFVPVKPAIRSNDGIRIFQKHPRPIVAKLQVSKQMETEKVGLKEERVKNLSLATESGGDNLLMQFFHRFLAAGGGKIGDRGEVYFFAQALPIMGIVFGGLPLISDVLRLVLGPGLLIMGIAVMGITALDMGESLTPWPKPNGEGLVTTGLYGQVRHPMYFGLLSFLVGFAIWTGSLDRLLLAAFLWPLLEIKAGYEETELAKVYPDYPDYKKQVQSRFIPKAILNFGTLLKEEE